MKSFSIRKGETVNVEFSVLELEAMLKTIRQGGEAGFVVTTIDETSGPKTRNFKLTEDQIRGMLRKSKTRMELKPERLN